MSVTKIEVKKNEQIKTSLWQPNILHDLWTLRNDRRHNETPTKRINESEWLIEINSIYCNEL